MLLSKNSCFLKTGGRFFQSLWPSHNILILQDIHYNEWFIYIILHVWLAMAEICRSPFDGDKHYDIDIVGELDQQLFDAAAALHSYKI